MMRKKILSFILFLIVIFFVPSCYANEIKDSYSIIIAGGGTGGTAAAIQASRMGADVLIIEPTYMLGGQATAAGVSTMDDMSRIESGIYKEFIDRVKNYYGNMKKSINTPYWKEHGKAFEPSIGDKILKDMAASADILFHSSIIDVKNGTEERFVTVKTPDGEKKINFKILIIWSKKILRKITILLNLMKLKKNKKSIQNLLKPLPDIYVI